MSSVAARGRAGLVKAAYPRCENPVKRRFTCDVRRGHYTGRSGIGTKVRTPSVRGKRLPQPAPRPRGWRSSTPTAASSASSPKRIGAVGWRAQVLGSPPPPEEVRAMRQHAIVIDVAMLGCGGVGIPRPYLRHLTESGGGGLHGPDLGRPAGAGPAARRRRLGHEALPSRGGAGARRGGAARAAGAERRSRIRRSRWSPASSRSGRTCSRPSSAGARWGSRGASSS